MWKEKIVMLLFFFFFAGNNDKTVGTDLECKKGWKKETNHEREDTRKGKCGV